MMFPKEDESEGYEQAFGKLHSLDSEPMGGYGYSNVHNSESGYASRADSIKDDSCCSVSGGRHTPDGYEDDEDDEEAAEAALEALENWITNDEDTYGTQAAAAASDLNKHVALPASKPKSKPTAMSSRERARKASRDLKREQNDTTGGSRRSLKREHLIIKWILRITHLDKDMSIDFADWVQDGTVLSQVMTTLCFNSVERDKYGGGGFSPEEERIKSLQAQILDYGVEQKYIFKMDDILKKKNTPKVIRCLEEVAKLSRFETHIKLDTLITNKLYT